MCFLIDDNDKDVKVAKTNIICYKVMYKSISLGIDYTSCIRLFDYKKHVVYYEELFHNTENKLLLYHGFHSIENKKSCSKYIHKYGLETIVKCIIPKGSKYYYNSSTKEYISDHIFIGSENMYNKKYPYGFK